MRINELTHGKPPPQKKNSFINIGMIVITRASVLSILPTTLRVRDWYFQLAGKETGTERSRESGLRFFLYGLMSPERGRSYTGWNLEPLVCSFWLLPTRTQGQVNCPELGLPVALRHPVPPGRPGREGDQWRRTFQCRLVH